MSERFEESVNEALERLASVETRTVDAVRLSIDALPDRRQPRRGLAALLAAPFAGIATAIAAIAVVAVVAAGLIPLWRANTGLATPTGAGATATGPTATRVVSVATQSPSPTPPLRPRFADPGGSVSDMQLLTATSGWALAGGPGGYAKLMVTDDAGATWRDATPPGTKIGNPRIDFLDGDHAWVLQAFSTDPNNPSAPVPSALWRTSDGGRHWEKGRLPVQAIFEATLSFSTPNDGLLLLIPDAAVGRRQTYFYSTTNGGATWTQVGHLAGEHQFDWPPARPLVALTKDDALFASGEALQTHDGGRSWGSITLPRPAEIPAAARPDVRDARIAGGDVLVSVQYVWRVGTSYNYRPGYEFVSHDRGRTWALAWTDARPPAPDTAVVAVDQTTIFRFPDYAGTIPATYERTFAVTRDGGRTWESIDAALPPETHFDIESFADPLNGWAVVSRDAHCPPTVACPYAGGLPGQLVMTTDGGKTWTVGALR